MAQRTSVRRTVIHAAPTRPRRRRFRWLRRFLYVIVVVVLLALAAYAYLLAVYAPGLRAEASRLPAEVHAQMAAQGATYVPLNQISPDLRHAIVSVEDRRFYYHPGIDPLGTIRAVIVNLLNQHIDQGGSTLEEQLAKRAIVHDDRSLHAKLRTMALAWAIDQDFSKSQILEMYLNDAYYGQGAYGPAAAARIYFGTDAAHLTLPEAAFLAALPQAPSFYGANPQSRVIIARKDTVLADMQESGYITTAQAIQAQNTPLRFAFPNP